jgi:hypothetical protein
LILAKKVVGILKKYLKVPCWKGSIFLELVHQIRITFGHIYLRKMYQVSNELNKHLGILATAP